MKITFKEQTPQSKESRFQFGPMDYDSTIVPEKYTCFRCGAKGCKLYRPYFFSLEAMYQNGFMVCRVCAWKVDETLVLIAAIPTQDGNSLYTNAPASAREWFERLPYEVKQ